MEENIIFIVIFSIYRVITYQNHTMIDYARELIIQILANIFVLPSANYRNLYCNVNENF